MTNSKSNSVNDSKQAKAVQVVTRCQALRLIAEMKKNILKAGGIKSIMQISSNFSYILTETKPEGVNFNPFKVGKKNFYLSPIGQVNEYNVLNVIKSFLKFEEAKRILAKKQSKRLTFDDFSQLKETKKRIDDMKAGLRLANIDMTAKQEKDTLHILYNEYLKNLGLDE